MSPEAMRRKMENWILQLPGAARDSLAKAADMVAKEMRLNLSGRILHKRTGALAGAVATKVTLRPLKALIYILGSQQYKAQTHEYGKTIRPRYKQALKFPGTNHWVTVRAVRVPARPFAQRSEEAQRGNYLQMLAKDLTMEFKRARNS